MRKPFRKILLGLGLIVGLIVLLIGGLVLYATTSAPPQFADVKVPELKLEQGSVDLVHGRQLVEMNCKGCHGNQETGRLDGSFFGENPLGTAWTANITRHETAGVGKYSAGEFYRMLRTGVKRDNTLALPFMPRFPQLSESDLNDIIAFLQSDDPLLTPSSTERSTDLSLLGRILVRFAFKPVPYVLAEAENPTLEDPVAYGSYLVNSQLLCFACHSATHDVNLVEPAQSTGYLQGGAEFGPNLHSPSLLRRVDGLAGWSREDFLQTLKSGVRATGDSLRAPMFPYAQLDTAEIMAIWEYLGTVSPPANEE